MYDDPKDNDVVQGSNGRTCRVREFNAMSDEDRTAFVNRIPQINEKVGVIINGHEYEVLVAGVERGFGKNSPVTVKFYIDWDEGPLEYRCPLKDVRLLPES